MQGIATCPGFQVGGLHCGLKRKRLDLAWLYSEVPAVSAAVYTKNLFQAAPLEVTRQSLKQNSYLQALVVNAGVANACTGEKGLANAYQMRELFANQMQLSPDLVAVASTGVIGEQLPMDKIAAGIGTIDRQKTDQEAFHQAILTTDTRTKQISIECIIDGKPVTIAGAAKGSGMIHPNMATMLAFLTSDVNVDPVALKEALTEAVDQSFNMITVDGDTSTNDMVLIMANGLADNNLLTAKHPDWPVFVTALNQACKSLAKQIVSDGEGATKLVEVTVKGASSKNAAVNVAKSVLGSNLVKTALFGRDPNYGRIICAIGYSGEAINPDQVSVSLGKIAVVVNGEPCIFAENEAREYLNRDEIEINIDLKQGNYIAKGWGCDLGYDYIKINASYRS